MRWWAGRWTVVSAVVVAGGMACGPKIELEEDSATSSAETEPGGGNTGAQTTSSSSSTSAPTSVGTSSGPTGTVTTENPSTSGIPTATATSSTTGPGDGLMNGEPCARDEDCASGFCYDVGVLGGLCGECNSDADCPGGGCSSPNPLDGSWAVCNEGNFGEGCDTDAACIGDLMCAVIIDVPGVLTESTCSECQTDVDCIGQLCSPVYDVAQLTGAKVCVGVADVPLGEGCEVFGSGDIACSSGHCAAADLMGVLTLGVCSACETDLDCFDGTSCFPPSIDFSTGLVPGMCG